MDIALAHKYRVPKLLRLIDSLKECTDNLGAICICYDYDDDETIESLDVIKAAYDNIKFIVSDQPGSTAIPLNKALSLTDSKYVALLGNDATVKTKGWDTIAHRLFEMYPKHRCLSFFPSCEPIYRVINTFRYPFYCIFEREVLLSLGGFNETFRRAAADQQLGVDMMQAGALMLVCNEIIVEHDREVDELIKKNMGQAKIDNELFRSIWVPRRGELKQMWRQNPDWGLEVDVNGRILARHPCP